MTIDYPNHWGSHAIAAEHRHRERLAELDAEAAYQRGLSDGALCDVQLAVLEALHHLGPLSQGQLCQKILRSGSNVTTVVDNLERNELVRRDRDKEDRRIQIVTLTQRGRDVISAAFPEHVARVTEIMAALTSAEPIELGRICLKLGKSVPT